MVRSLRANGISGFLREFRFHPSRRWRFDFAWSEQKLALEVEGGIWVAGAHTRGAHFTSDCEKYNEAVLLGWRVLRVTSDMVLKGRATELVRHALGSVPQEYYESLIAE